MSEYYAVVRSDDSLKHYGVRGMKWGVIKAKAKRSDKKIAKIYKKAVKKLEQLNRNADVGHQKIMTQYHKKKAVRSGLATIGLGGLTKGGMKITEGLIRNSPYETIHKGHRITQIVHPTTAAKASGGATFLSAIGTVAGLAKTGAHIEEAIASKRRTTAKGHAKAIAKRDAWKKEMNKAFAGTKYANSAGINKKHKTKR